MEVFSPLYERLHLDYDENEIMDFIYEQKCKKSDGEIIINAYFLFILLSLFSFSIMMYIKS